MIKGLENFEFHKNYSACDKCEYKVEDTCTNSKECFWKTLEGVVNAVDNLRNEITVYKYSTYAPEMNRDCMCYVVKFKNGRTEGVSRELYVLLEGLLNEN